MGEGNWSPPKWMYRDRKPPSDDSYFENMIRVIFMAGLNWRMISEKWSHFRKAFVNFSVDEVAKFGANEIQRLMNNKGIVRNKAKIAATVRNAVQFQNIRGKYGSFHQYLESLDKSNNYALAIEELGSKFSRVGPSSARIFLYSVGENIRQPME
ncbi:MAG: DNA-3-methyladenine glycosylase I [Candidatus Bathyarchaeota archaeon]|nr:MAG: DNA-3-methyladenine glycosylase I [Candidatus Bathyarchaeota archaeon]